MKRFLVFLLSMLLCLSAVACGNNNRDVHVPVNFYYRTDIVDYNSAQGVVAPEVREGAGYENDLAALVNLYLRGPASEGFLSPFPAGLQVETISQNETVVEITLGGSFSTLTGHNLSVACTCISMTLMDLTQCQTVRIYAHEGLLDGSDCVEMTRDSILLLDKQTTPSEP